MPTGNQSHTNHDRGYPDQDRWELKTHAAFRSQGQGVEESGQGAEIRAKGAQDQVGG